MTDAELREFCDTAVTLKYRNRELSGTLRCGHPAVNASYSIETLEPQSGAKPRFEPLDSAEDVEWVQSAEIDRPINSRDHADAEHSEESPKE